MQYGTRRKFKTALQSSQIKLSEAIPPQEEVAMGRYRYQKRKQRIVGERDGEQITILSRMHDGKH
jgi:hypothetical protein